jgi:membrane-bound serine protease (ClpP class)
METSQLILAVVLIAVGLVLLVADVFLPSAGLLSIGGLVLIVAGVAVPFYYGDHSTGLLSLVAVFILVPAAVSIAFHLMPRTPLGRRMILPTGGADDATVATMPVNLELEQLRGRIGKAVSPLRPAGVVDFDGRRIDCLTEGMMVDPGTWVRCIDVKAARVVVRPVDGPRPGEFEELDLS